MLFYSDTQVSSTVDMQAWQESDYSGSWAKDTGVDVRGLRFAKDVRLQLLQIVDKDPTFEQSAKRKRSGGLLNP